MPLIQSNKLLFLHIPKTGGTTIESALGMHDSQCFFAFAHYKNYKVCPQHLYYNELLLEVKNLKEYEVFTIVRNPFDRLVSEYYHTLSGVNKLTFPFYKEHTFESFVYSSLKLQKSQRQLIFDRHLEPQYLFIEGCKNINIFKFEELQNCFSYLNNKMNKELVFGHERKSEKRSSYRDYYNENLKIFVEEFYRKDLELFNYTF